MANNKKEVKLIELTMMMGYDRYEQEQRRARGEEL
jgi:hypothetical protein